MSSTFVADTTDDHKSDNTLIIIVNNDGTVSVDQETLQNLIGKCCPYWIALTYMYFVWWQACVFEHSAMV
jgi:hypothetical protein